MLPPPTPPVIMGIFYPTPNCTIFFSVSRSILGVSGLYTVIFPVSIYNTVEHTHTELKRMLLLLQVDYIAHVHMVTKVFF